MNPVQKFHATCIRCSYEWELIVTKDSKDPYRCPECNHSEIELAHLPTIMPDSN